MIFYKSNINYALLGLLCLMLSVQRSIGQNRPKKFSYSPYAISAGQNVKIVYKPDDAQAKITGSVYLFRNFEWEGHDLPLTKTDTGYIADYKVPDGTALMSYRFWVGDTVDVGGRFPYAIILHNKTGNGMASGSLTEWGLFRFKQADLTMMPIVSPTSQIEPKILVSLWISKEYQNIDVRRNMFFDIARGIKSYVQPPAKADSIILQGGKDILKLEDVTEREMVTVERTYRSILHNQAAADSVKALTLSKFPSGLRRRLLAIDSIYLSMDPAIREARYNAVMQRYPADKFSTDDYLNPSISDAIFYLNGNKGVITNAFMQKNYAVVKKMLKEAPYRMLNYYYLYFVDYPMRRTVAEITPEQQLEFSTDVITEIMRRSVTEDKALSGRGYFTAVEWPRIVMRENRLPFTFHAKLLYKAGDFAGALKYAEMIKPYINYQNIDFNTVYVNLLDHNHRFSEAQQYLEKAISFGFASPEMLSILKEYYVKKHGNDTGFDEYYTSLIPAKQIEAMHQKLEKSMINIPAPLFNIKNNNGESVDLDKQKGKIIVLDFWASWCFPCKAAMPGMQTLVKKYKSDNGVQFYFIVTLEESPNYKKLATDFIKQKKYDFNVLYDEMNASTGRLGLVFNSYAKLLHMNGIPQKVIIDTKGNVRWVSDGFNGDLVNLTREVDYVISVIQKEKP